MENNKLIILAINTLIISVILACVISSNIYALPPDLPVIISGKVVSSSGAVIKGPEIRVSYYDKEDSIVEVYIKNSLDEQYLFQVNDIDTNKPVVISFSNEKLSIDPVRGEVNRFTLTLPDSPIKKNFIEKIIGNISRFFSDIFSSNRTRNDVNEQNIIATIPEKGNDPGKIDDNRYAPDTGKDSFSSDNSIINSTSNAANFDLKHPNYLTAILIILGLIIIIFIISYIVNFTKSGMIQKFRISMEKIRVLKAERIISEDNDCLDPGDNASDALEYFIKHSNPDIPVVFENNIVGIITKRALLETYIKNKNPEKIKLRYIMLKKFTTCTHDEAISKVYAKMIKSGSDTAVVTKDSEYLGVITYPNFIKLFSNGEYALKNPPMLFDAVFEDPVYEKDSVSVQELMDNFISKRLDYCIITKDDAPIGIVTLKDLINAIANSVDRKKYVAQNIMSPHLMTMNPETEIYEAFRVMSELKYKQIPITVNKKIEGIVNERTVVQLFYKYAIQAKKDV